MKQKPTPPLNALKAFEAVSRHINVSRAANELHVTPSAISHLIRRLEENIGAKLIERSGRNISLTTIGQSAGSELQKAFQSLRVAVNNIQQSIERRIVTISCRPYFAAKWLAPRLENFWSNYSDIELHLHHTNQMADLNSGEVDLSIEWLDGDRENGNLSKLVAGNLTPVFSPSLKNSSKIKQPKDLLNYPLLRETDFNSWQTWFNQCGCSIPEKLHSIYMDDSNVRYQAALDGQGVELSCRSLILKDLQTGQLIAPFEQSIQEFSYYLVEPENRNLSVSATIFRNWLYQQINNAKTE